MYCSAMAWLSVSPVNELDAFGEFLVVMDDRSLEIPTEPSQPQT
jgi:hypothetical protein